MAREKRPLEKDTSSDGMPEEKRQRVPALASVIVEAVKMDSLQKLCSTLEPLLRRVVGEEVERVLAKLTPAKVGFRSSPKRIQGSDSRSLRLQFRNKLALPLFTGSKVEGEQGSAIHVVLQDASTGQVVTVGAESSAKLEVVVLEGDFSADDEEDWPQEDFENHEVRERDGKRPLLTGDLFVTLKDGVGTLGELTFTDNSSWIRSRKFRLGIKISSGYCEGLRIREAKTEPFTVKDHRGELYKKHYPPALHDEVWRLDKIGKDGAFHKRLNQSGIQSVEDFLRLVVMDPQKLRNVYVDKLVKVAYENWENVVEYDGEALIGVKPYKLRGIDAHTEDPIVGQGSSGPQSLTSACNQHAVSSTQIMSSQRPQSGGQAYTTPEQKVHMKYLNQVNAMAEHHNSEGFLNPGLSYPSQPSLISLTHQTYLHGVNSPVTGLALGLPHASISTPPGPSVAVLNGTTTLPGTVIPTNDWPRYKELRGQEGLSRTMHMDELFSEDELRVKSMGILENEDMHLQIQQLLRMFNAASGEVPSNPYSGGQGEDNFSFGAFTPPPDLNVGMDRARVNGRANVGWLKLKAALRWGIFIRKRAAARRAQLEELEDEGSG